MTTAEAAMAVVSFENQMKHARELVDEGHRLLNIAQRDLSTGRVLVKQGRKMLLTTRERMQRRPLISTR
jgi:exonuclease VII small subunit